MSAVKFDLAIVGLGYVGLPLGLQFAKSGCRVLGLDVDAAISFRRIQDDDFESARPPFNRQKRDAF